MHISLIRLFLISPILSIVSDICAIIGFIKLPDKFRYHQLFLISFTLMDIILSIAGLILFGRHESDIYSGHLCYVQSTFFVMGFIYRAFGAFVFSYIVYIVFSESVFSEKISYTNPLIAGTFGVATITLILGLSLGCLDLTCSGHSFAHRDEVSDYDLKVFLLQLVVGIVPGCLLSLSLVFLALTVRKTKQFYVFTANTSVSKIIIIFLDTYKTIIAALTISILPMGVNFGITFALGLCECRLFYFISSFLFFSTGLQSNVFFFYVIYRSTNPVKGQMQIESDKEESIYTNTELQGTIVSELLARNTGV